MSIEDYVVIFVEIYIYFMYMFIMNLYLYVYYEFIMNLCLL